MDNNNDNNYGSGYYNSEPQKPFTEKTTEQPMQEHNAEAQQNFDFEPEQPLVNKHEDHTDDGTLNTQPGFDQQNAEDEEPFNPIQNTSSYANSAFTNSTSYNSPQQSYQQNYQQNRSNVPPMQNQNYYSNAPQGNYQPNSAYNQGAGYNPNQNGYNGYSEPQQQNYNRYSYHQGNSNIPQYGNAATNNIPQMPLQPTVPKKSNKGLIAVIIVLSVLLLGSIVGICVYITSNISNASNNNQTDNAPAFSFTLPQGGDNQVPQTTTAPQSSHKESDYSDKTISDYSGLSLESKPKDAGSSSDYSAEYAFNKASSSVVGVVCYADEVTSVDNCSSQGSGMIITSDGYVVTNAHVVGNSKTAYLIQIVTADGKTYNAGVVGVDSRTDIAVLKMDDAKDLTPATFGNSDDVELGEDIIVIGNPGGLDFQNSLTKGVVSAINREGSSSSLVKYIQTDAAINPGNSGGPIVNLYGQVIGIATSKIVSEKYEGMGFAIPSATAKDIVDSLMKNGYVDGRVKIGITGEAVNFSAASQYNIPQGILIASVSADGPCANSGLKTNDIITEVDGQSVTNFSQVYEILENHKDGDKIKLKYYRYSDNSNGEVEITLQADK